VGLLQLHDCLSALVHCSSALSDEGLLQLLLTVAKAQLGSETPGEQQLELSRQQQQQQQQGHDPVSDSRLLSDIHGSTLSLVSVLLGRLPGMSLVQLVRLSRALEGGPGTSSSSSGSSSGGGGPGSSSSSSRPGWYVDLLRDVKAAMAARA
jgi:hypothetical protein